MAVVILLYDQLIFRPIVAWADKFRFEHDGRASAAALVGLRRGPPHAALAQTIAGLFGYVADPCNRCQRSSRAQPLRTRRDPAVATEPSTGSGSRLSPGVVVWACGRVVCLCARHSRHA